MRSRAEVAVTATSNTVGSASSRSAGHKLRRCRSRNVKHILLNIFAFKSSIKASLQLHTTVNFNLQRLLNQ